MHLSGNLKYLRKRKNVTQAEFGAAIGIGRTTIANYESGISEPNMVTIVECAIYFSISVDALLTKDLEHQISEVPKDNAASPKNFPQIVTIATDGLENITYVPVKARAGYLLGYGDPEFMETLPSFRMPGLRNATYRMFEIEGLSMAPNILPGDRVIGEFVEDMSNIADNSVYIVVHEGGIAIKRLMNGPTPHDRVYLKSDTTTYRQEFPTKAVYKSEIKELWVARLKVSSDFTEPDAIHHRIADLEKDVLEMKRIFKTFKD